MRPPGYGAVGDKPIPIARMDFGAYGDGIHDDTAAIQLHWRGKSVKPPLDERLLFQVGKGSRAYRKPALIDPADHAAVCCWALAVIVGLALWAGVIVALKAVL